jgi:hypothetical protein
MVLAAAASHVLPLADWLPQPSSLVPLSRKHHFT